MADPLTKHVPRAVLDKLAGKMGYTFPFEETQKNQKMEAVERLLVFDGGENESLEDDVHSFVDKTSHLTTAVLYVQRHSPFGCQGTPLGGAWCVLFLLR